jgi:Glycosyl transferase family 64 domain
VNRREGMDSRYWSKSLLRRFRAAPVVDSNSRSIDKTTCSSSCNSTMKIETKKASSVAQDDNAVGLNVQNESLPMIQPETLKDRRTLPRQILRDFRTRWYRLTPKTRRFVVLCILPIVVFYLTTEAIDEFFPRYSMPPRNDINISLLLNISRTNEFAVVVNTYQRPKQLQDAVRHYAERCGPTIGIQSIYIIWAEETVLPPTPESFFTSSSQRKVSQRATVKILPVRNSLNSRFLPIPEVQDMAVFMVDDDIRVDCQSLQRGFEAWKSNPHSMVGYYPRLSSIDYSEKNIYIRAPPTSFIYHSWPIVYWRQELNFILTKASFLHSHYMSIYSDPQQHPIEILKYIDKYFNCEDVAMSLLVANITKPGVNQLPAQPIYVEGNVIDKGLFNGISTGTGHMTQRSKCLKDLTAIYTKHGWDMPLDHSFSLRQSSWRQHQFWWQSQPSNIYEWFALSNIFK